MLISFLGLLGCFFLLHRSVQTLCKPLRALAFIPDLWLRDGEVRLGVLLSFVMQLCEAGVLD